MPTKVVPFGDNLVTPKARDMLEKAYAQKTLGLPCVIEFEQDDSEFKTLETLLQHAKDMGGCIIRLHLGMGQPIENVTERNIGSGHFLVYLP